MTIDVAEKLKQNTLIISFCDHTHNGLMLYLYIYANKSTCLICVESMCESVDDYHLWFIDRIDTHARLKIKRDC